MNNIVGLAVFGLGIVLLIFGLTTIPSPGAVPQLSSNHSTWMLVGGAAAVIGGLILAIFSRRN
ncbi:MAG: DUF3185 family protein [Verrucomicrobiota bacterium]